MSLRLAKLSGSMARPTVVESMESFMVALLWSEHLAARQFKQGRLRGGLALTRLESPQAVRRCELVDTLTQANQQNNPFGSATFVCVIGIEVTAPARWQSCRERAYAAGSGAC